MGRTLDMLVAGILFAGSGASADPSLRVPQFFSRAQDQKAPIPSDTAVKDAEKRMKEIYKSYYAKKDLDGQRELAKKLYDDGLETKNNDALRYAILHESFTVASKNFDIEAAFRAAEALEASFAGPKAFNLKNEALTTAQKHPLANTQDGAIQLAESYLALTEDAVGKKDYKAATPAAASAKKFARAAKAKLLEYRANNWAEDIPLLEREYQTVELALSVGNVDDPTKNDAATNRLLGLFQCYANNKWDDGLEFLENAEEPIRKMAALKRTLLSKDEPELHYQLGNHLYALATDKANQEIYSKLDIKRFRKDALHHLRAALHGATGALKTQYEGDQKLQKMLTELDDMPKDIGGVVNLLSLIDPKKDSVVGDWSKSGQYLVTPAANQARLQVPYIPSDEYDLCVVASHKTGNDALIIGLAKGDRQFEIVLDGWGGNTSGIDLIDGKPGLVNGTAYYGKIFTDGKPRTIMCAVRKANVTVTVDGKTIINTKVDYTRVTPYVKLPNPRALYVGSQMTSYQINELQLTPKSGGQGKKTR